MGSPERLRVGVAGLGMGMNHLASYLKNPRVELAALCDWDERWLDHVSADAHPLKKYTRYEDMIADPGVDAISVCLPTSLHASTSIAAMEAGKHVLCEKPMATCLDEAETMKKIAMLTGKKLMISHQQRFGHDIRFLKHHADNGYFGDLYYIHLVWRRPPGMLPTPFTKRPDGSVYSRNWFNEKDHGGGVLRDLGTHMIDLAMYLTGFPGLSDACGSLYRKFFPEGYREGLYTVDSEDSAVACIRFGSGLVIQLEVNFSSYTDEESIVVELYGSKGGASRINGNVKLFSSIAGADVITQIQRFSISSKSSQDYFVDAILDGMEVPIPAWQGVEVIRVLDAIYASAGGIG